MATTTTKLQSRYALTAGADVRDIFSGASTCRRMLDGQREARVEGRPVPARRYTAVDPAVELYRRERAKRNPVAKRAALTKGVRVPDDTLALTYHETH